MLDYILLIAGLAMLLVGGDVLVRGAVGLAEKLKIPALVIGLTIVAFGTSAPELFISVKAALSGASGIAIGNVVGSNIANVLLVMGLPAIVAAYRCEGDDIGRNIVVMIGFTLVFMVILATGTIGRFEGIVLLALLGLFLWDQLRSAKSKISSGAPVHDYHEDVPPVPKSNLVIGAMLLAGLVTLPIGANLTVEAASTIARSWNVSDAVIGLTIVAIGTSLPELATSLLATIRGSNSIAIGNVVGSNIFNIGSIMGITAMIQPMNVGPHIAGFDMWIMLLCALAVAILAHWKIKVGKRVGFAMIGSYTVYVIATFLF
jgi:cation:H+ antiporter